MDEAEAPEPAEEAPEAAADEPTTAVAPQAPTAVAEQTPASKPSIGDRIRSSMVRRTVNTASTRFSTAAARDLQAANAAKRAQETKAQESARLAAEADATAARLRAEAEQAATAADAAGADATSYEARAAAEAQAAEQIRQVGETYLAKEAELRAQAADNVETARRIRDEQVEAARAEQQERVNAAAEQRAQAVAEAATETEAAAEALRVAKENFDAATINEFQTKERGDAEVAEATSTAQTEVSRVHHMHTRQVNRAAAEGQQRVRDHRKALGAAISEAARVAPPQAPQEAEIA